MEGMVMTKDRGIVDGATAASPQRWVRGALGYLAVTSVGVGAWASFLPNSFYNSFPGGGRQWIAGDGPFNEHMVSDAGAGFLAIGVVAILAAVWLDRRLVLTASAAVVVHAVVHLAFHLRHAHPTLGSVDTALSNGGLALSAAVAGAVLVAGVRTGRTPAPNAPTGAVAPASGLTSH